MNFDNIIRFFAQLFMYRGKKGSEYFKSCQNCLFYNEIYFTCGNHDYMATEPDNWCEEWLKNDLK